MADAPSDSGDTKSCPLCGETIKAVAVRCKHCHADLSAAKSADFDRGHVAAPTVIPHAASGPRSLSDAEFEQHLLDFAYQTHERLTAISVAHALKVPIAVADDRLEALAAGDTIHRHVDDEAGIYYTLPGNHGRLVVHGGAGPLVPARPAPTEAAAMAGLILNLCMPGVGSIVAGKPGPGIAQLALVVIGLPLCLVFIGFPMVFSAWVWSLMTANEALREAKEAELAS